MTPDFSLKHPNPVLDFSPPDHKEETSSENSLAIPENIPLSKKPFQLRLTPADALLYSLKTAGIIDDDWIVNDSFANYPVDTFVLNPTTILNFLNRGVTSEENSISFEEFLNTCYQAAICEGVSIDSFEILGSFVNTVLEDMTTSPDFDDLCPSLAQLLKMKSKLPRTFHDIDFRIEVSGSKNLSGFIGRFKKIFPYQLPFAKEICLFDNDTQKVTLEAENIKLGMADLTYCFFDTNEGARTEHQKLRIDILPHLQRKETFGLKGTLQALIDIKCGIARWVKEHNDEWDLCGYIFMLGQGNRFPSDDAEIKLLQVFEKKTENNKARAIETISKFKKLNQCTGNEKAVYLLNAALVLDLDFNELLKQMTAFHAESPLLDEFINLIGRGELPLNVASAALQMVALRLLTMDKSILPVLTFSVELTTHKRLPHIALKFDNSRLMIPLNMKEAWDLLQRYCSASAGNTATILSLIRMFGRMNEFKFAAKSDLKADLKQLAPFLQVPYDELSDGLTARNAILNRLACFLFVAQIQLFPDKESFVAAVEFGNRATLREQGLDEEFCESLMHYDSYLTQLPLEKAHFAKGMMEYLYGGRQPLYCLSCNLLYLFDRVVFSKALEWLGSQPFDLQPILQHQLKFNRMGNVLELAGAVKNHDDIPMELWRDLIRRTTVNLTSGNAEEDMTKKLDRFAKVLLPFLNQYGDQFEFTLETEGLVKQFDAYLTQNEGQKLATYRTTWAMRLENEQLALAGSAFKKSPEPKTLAQLLEFCPRHPDEVRQIFLDFVSEAKRDQIPLLYVFLEAVALDQLFASVAHKTMLMVLMKKLILNGLNGPKPDFEVIFKLLLLELPFPTRFYIDTLATIFSQTEVNLKLVVKEFYGYLIQKATIPDDDLFELELGLLAIELSPDPNDRRPLEIRCRTQLIRMSYFNALDQILTLFRKLLTHPNTSKNLDVLFYLIVNVRSLIKPNGEKNVELQIIELDCLFALTILNNFGPKFYDGISIVTEIIVYGKWQKPRQAQFRQAFVKVLQAENSRPGPLDDHLKKIFKTLITNLTDNPNYSEIIDEWVRTVTKEDLRVFLFENLRNLPALMGINSNSKLPLTFLEYIEAKLDQGVDLQGLTDLSLPVSSEAFQNHTSTLDYLRIYKKYCDAYFGMLFQENSHFTKQAEKLYNFLSTEYGTQFANHPPHTNIKNWEYGLRLQDFFEKHEKRGLYACGHTLLIRLLTNFLSMISVYTATTNETFITLAAHYQKGISLIQPEGDELMNLPLFTPYTENIYLYPILCMNTTLMGMELTRQPLMMLRNNIVLNSISHFGIDEHPALIPQFDHLIYMDQSQLSDFNLKFYEEGCTLALKMQGDQRRKFTGRVNDAELLYFYTILLSNTELELLFQRSKTDKKSILNEILERSLYKILEKFKDKTLYFSKQMIARMISVVKHLWVDSQRHRFLMICIQISERDEWKDMSDLAVTETVLSILEGANIFLENNPRSPSKNYDEAIFVQSINTYTSRSFIRLTNLQSNVRIAVKYLLFLNNIIHTTRNKKTKQQSIEKQKHISEKMGELITTEIKKFKVRLDIAADEEMKSRTELCVSFCNDLYQISNELNLLSNWLSNLNGGLGIWNSVFNIIKEQCDKTENPHRGELCELGIEILMAWKSSCAWGRKNGTDEIIKNEMIALITAIGSFTESVVEHYEHVYRTPQKIPLKKKIDYLYVDAHLFVGIEAPIPDLVSRIHTNMIMGIMPIGGADWMATLNEVLNMTTLQDNLELHN